MREQTQRLGCDKVHEEFSLSQAGPDDFGGSSRPVAKQHGSMSCHDNYIEGFKNKLSLSPLLRWVKVTRQTQRKSNHGLKSGCAKDKGRGAEADA
jgi:hypothetical protein